MRTFQLKILFITISLEKVVTSFLRFRVSQPGHFKELRTGEASPSLFPSTSLGARGSSGFPIVTQKRHHDLLAIRDMFIRT